MGDMVTLRSDFVDPNYVEPQELAELVHNISSIELGHGDENITLNDVLRNVRSVPHFIARFQPTDEEIALLQAFYILNRTNKLPPMQGRYAGATTMQMVAIATGRLSRSLQQWYIETRGMSFRNTRSAPELRDVTPEMEHKTVKYIGLLVNHYVESEKVIGGLLEIGGIPAGIPVDFDVKTISETRGRIEL